MAMDYRHDLSARNAADGKAAAMVDTGNCCRKSPLSVEQIMYSQQWMPLKVPAGSTSLPAAGPTADGSFPSVLKPIYWTTPQRGRQVVSPCASTYHPLSHSNAELVDTSIGMYAMFPGAPIVVSPAACKMSTASGYALPVLNVAGSVPDHALLQSSTSTSKPVAGNVNKPCENMQLPSDSALSGDALTVAINQLGYETFGEVVSDLEEIIYAMTLQSRKRHPPDDYLCHVCFIKGHFIKDCPQAKPPDDDMTPYQGKKRCFGEFKCPNCKRKWCSGNSWSNTGQDCIKCKIHVLPFKQRPLNRGIELVAPSTITSVSNVAQCQQPSNACGLAMPLMGGAGLR